MASQLFRQSLRTLARTSISKPLMVRGMNATVRPSIIKPTLYRSFSVAMPRMAAGESKSHIFVCNNKIYFYGNLFIY